MYVSNRRQLSKLLYMPPFGREAKANKEKTTSFTWLLIYFSPDSQNGFTLQYLPKLMKPEAKINSLRIQLSLWRIFITGYIRFLSFTRCCSFGGQFKVSFIGDFMVVLIDVHCRQHVGISVIGLQNLCCTASCWISVKSSVVWPEMLKTLY